MNTDIGHEYIDMYLGNSMNQYGVLGMKWGISHRRNKLAMTKYRNDLKKLRQKGLPPDKMAKKIKKIEKARDYNLRTKSRDVAIANELYPYNSKSLNERVVKAKMPETLAKSAVLSSYGALKYDSALAKGKDDKGAYKSGYGSGYVNNLLVGAPSQVLYGKNLSKRLKNRKKAIAEGTNDPYLQPTKVKRKKKSK